MEPHPFEEDAPAALEDVGSTGGDERLARCAQLVSATGSFTELCQQVVADPRYAASTRAVFQELLEQARGAIGQLR